MNDNRFEPAFSKEFRKRQNKFSLKYYGIILPVVMIALLYALYRVYGSNVTTYIMQGITILLCSCIWFLDIRYRCWLAQCFQLTEAGIVIRSWRKKERTIPWSSVVAVDTGSMSGYDSRAIMVIRCFLSESAWEKMIPTLKKPTVEDSPRSYYALQKDCFAIEYSGEMEQMIMNLWGRTNKNSRDEAVSDTGFDYVFSEELRSKFHEIKGVYILVYYALVLLIYLICYLVNGHISEAALGCAAIYLSLPLFVICALKSDQDSTQWILKSKCRLCRDGIYLKSDKNKTAFIPWEDFVCAEHRRMNIDASASVSVICCYRSLTGKSLLERAAKPSLGKTKYPMYQEFYHLRDEVVTIGYTRSRMRKIRAVCKESPWQK